MLPLLAPWPACMPCGSHHAHASHTPDIETLCAVSPTFHPQDQLHHRHCISSTPLHLMVWLHQYPRMSCAMIDHSPHIESILQYLHQAQLAGSTFGTHPPWLHVSAFHAHAHESFWHVWSVSL